MTFWVAGAALVGTVVSGAIGSDSARHAANQQKDATGRALDETGREYDTTRSDYAPWREAGGRALTQYESEINGTTTPADVMADPGYQFGLDQGQRALDRKTAAGGGRVSGAALKSAADYATNYATTGYQAAYQRRQDRLNRLATLANVGQTAVAGTTSAGTTLNGQSVGLISGQGNANAAATLAQGNIWQNGVNQIGAMGQRWANTPSQGGVSYTGDSVTDRGNTYYEG